MYKGKAITNILVLLGFITIFCSQLYGLTPRQLARLRSLETELKTRFKAGPGANPKAWAARNQTIINQIRQLDPPSAADYQSRQDDFTREVKERIAREAAETRAGQAEQERLEEAAERMAELREETEARITAQEEAKQLKEARRTEQSKRTRDADNVLANVGEEIKKLKLMLKTPFESEEIFEMPTNKIQAIKDNIEPLLHRIESLLATANELYWQDISPQVKHLTNQDALNFNNFIIGTFNRFSIQITNLNKNTNLDSRNKVNFEKTAQAIRNMKIILDIYRRLPRVLGFILFNQEDTQINKVIKQIEGGLSKFKIKLYTKYNAKKAYTGGLFINRLDPTKVVITIYNYDSDDREWKPRTIKIEDPLSDIPPSLADLQDSSAEKQEKEEKEKKEAARDPLSLS